MRDWISGHNLVNIILDLEYLQLCYQLWRNVQESVFECFGAHGSDYVRFLFLRVVLLISFLMEWQ